MVHGSNAAAADEGTSRGSSTDAIEWRLRSLEEDRHRITEILERMVRLEEFSGNILGRLTSGARTMDDHEARVRLLEAALPVLKLTSRWVIAGVLGIFGLVAMAAFRLLFAAG